MQKWLDRCQTATAQSAQLNVSCSNAYMRNAQMVPKPTRVVHKWGRNAHAPVPDALHRRHRPFSRNPEARQPIASLSECEPLFPIDGSTQADNALDCSGPPTSPPHRQLFPSSSSS